MEPCSFAELALRGKEILDKQGPVTLEEAKAQVEMLKKNSKCNCPIAQGFSASVLQTDYLSSSLSGTTLGVIAQWTEPLPSKQII